jgi:hypothetical protein
MIYEISNAIAVSENIAFAATGLAKSSKPGRMLNSVVPQIAFIGVRVEGWMRPKKPLSGRPAYEEVGVYNHPESREAFYEYEPWSRLKAYTVREHACRAVWQTKNAVKQTNTFKWIAHKSVFSTCTTTEVLAHPDKQSTCFTHSESHDLEITLEYCGSYKPYIVKNTSRTAEPEAPGKFSLKYSFI